MKRLSPEAFDHAIQSIAIADHLREIARGVLVEGKTQAFFVREHGLSASAVSRACNRVIDVARAQQAQEQGLVLVQTYLTQAEASVVRHWGSKYPVNQ